jgi:hypothetical protein
MPPHLVAPLALTELDRELALTRSSAAGYRRARSKRQYFSEYEEARRGDESFA